MIEIISDHSLSIPTAYTMLKGAPPPLELLEYGIGLTHFQAKLGEIKWVSMTPPVMVVGLGENPTPLDCQVAFGELSRFVRHLDVVQVILPDSSDDTIRAAVMGWELGRYQYHRFQSNAEKSVCKMRLVTSRDKAGHLLDNYLIMANATCQARDLANTPANELTPSHFLAHIKKVFDHLPVEIEVIDTDRATQLGMGAFVGVAQGSDEPAYIVVIRYQPVKSPPIALVGKGVTFDSGGVSIKPSKGMSDMKADMSGAAAVVSAMVALVTMGVPQPITAVVALTENMLSGRAQRPGDVVTAFNGKTIEIINTDAEGRLVLADALSYIISVDSPKMILDMATLTGACSVALGEMASGILGNNQALIDELITVGERVGERVWQLPLWDEYITYLKSDVADLANASELGKAGTCTGAKFLEQFVGDTPWVHVDIASTMKTAKTDGFKVKGMSGVGVQLLIEWLKSLP